MRLSPYDTTICRMYRPEEIKRTLQRTDIQYPLAALVTPMGNVIQHAAMVTFPDDHLDVPAFTQCLNIGNVKTPKWVMDGRPYMSYQRRDDSYRLVAENDFAFQCQRLALTQVAEQQGAVALARLGDVPIKSFVRWVTLGIAQRYNLPLETQMRMSVITAYYYLTQLDDNLVLDGTERHRVANQVSRVSAIPTPQVLAVIEAVGELTNVEDLATALREHGGSVRLQQFKATDLLLLLAASWIGVNSRENVGVALEHIPTFVALVYAALSDRSFRKSMIRRRVETVGRQSEQTQFTQQVYRLIDSRFE